MISGTSIEPLISEGLNRIDSRMKAIFLRELWKLSAKSMGKLLMALDIVYTLFGVILFFFSSQKLVGGAMSLGGVIMLSSSVGLYQVLKKTKE